MLVLQTGYTHTLSCLTSEHDISLLVMLRGHIYCADSEQVKWVNLSEPPYDDCMCVAENPEHVCVGYTSCRAGRSGKHD